MQTEMYFPIIFNFCMTIIKNIRRNIYDLLIFLDNARALSVACGGILRQLEGNITGPTSLPFNQSSYVCFWTLEPPESMTTIYDNRLTLTIKVVGYLGRSENRVNLIRENCIYPKYIELLGKEILIDFSFSFSLFLDNNCQKK